MILWIGRVFLLLAMLLTWNEYSKVLNQRYDLAATARFMVIGIVITFALTIAWLVMEITSIRLAAR